MRFRRLIVTALLAAIGLASQAAAQSRAECGSLPSHILKHPVAYCALLPPSFDSSAPKPGQAEKSRHFPVLYYLHGRGDNEQSLINSGAWSLIEDLRRQRKIGEFVIVTPAGGSFYVNSADGKVRYSDFFLQEFMPFIERKYRIEASRNARGIDGMSMGGYGALRFGFSRPDLFGSVSAHSAALLPEPSKELNAAIRAGEPQAVMLGRTFGDPIDSANWEKNSPFALAKKNPSALRKLHIYFDCGDHDDFGFDRGATALDELLKKQNIAHEFHLYPGGHDIPYFLAHIAASIQFHSRWFAAASVRRP
jgi:S-formylglutathione hydrolase FrmB